MNFEPQKFFVGLIDFFSVLLPGALLTYLLKDNLASLFLADGYRFEETEGWIVFLFSSYLLGHFVFLFGSFADTFYDLIRKATFAQQVDRLFRGKELSPNVLRWLAATLIKADADPAVRQAVRIKESYLNPLEASSAVNAFQWCKARLTLEHPDAAATVHRFEADSKFFRSLLVVLVVLIPWGLLTGKPMVALISVPVLVVAFIRYVDQRVKATSQAYWYIITLEASSDRSARRSSLGSVRVAPRAGGVVYRKRDKKVEYLVVQSSKDAGQWVLPKGHVEPGERAEETAIREVREEAGVWARIGADLGVIEYDAASKPIEVQYYLMESVEEGEPAERRRGHEWLAFDQAVSRVTHPESKQLLADAEEKRAGRN